MACHTQGSSLHGTFFQCGPRTANPALPEQENPSEFEPKMKTSLGFNSVMNLGIVKIFLVTENLKRLMLF